MTDKPKLTKADIQKRLRALDMYESSQWNILRSPGYGGDDPDLLWRETDRCMSTRTKLMAMLRETE